MKKKPGPRPRTLTWVLCLFAVSACDHREASRSPQRSPELESSLARIVREIRGDRLMADLERYTAFGQRHYGAPERERVIATMIRDLEAHAASVERQDFTAVEPVSGVTYRLTNVFARTAPGAAARVLLATHWDTRLWADEDPDPARRDRPVPGANDGTSGLVVLIELLRALGRAGGLPAGLGLDIVLFDGEELGRAGSADYCRGSFHFAGDLRRFYPDRLPIAAVVVDMVGDRELTLHREALSASNAPELCDLVWRLGRDRFPEVFLDGTRGAVFDDHVPLQRRGIPAVLLIDLDYPPWHTLGDTPERCSAESLVLVTRHLGELLLVLAGTAGRESTLEPLP
jgi:Peptidase family M28